MSKNALKEVARVRTDNTPTTVKNLAKWLRECVYLISEDDSTARFERIVCRQLVKGNRRGEEVFYLDVPKKVTDEWPDSAALEIYAKLQTETATLGGLQKYALYAYHTGDNENHTSRFVMRLQGIDDDDEGDGLDSESPDKTGLTSQAMRHSEVFAKTMTASVMGMISGYQAMTSRLSGMVESLLADKLGNIEAIQSLMDEKEERDIRLVTAKAKAKGMEQLVGRLGMLMPVAVNKIAGKPIFPVQDASIMMMVKGLFGSLAADEDKLKALAGIMSTEQAVAFMTILEEVAAKTDDSGLPKKLREGDDKKPG